MFRGNAIQSPLHVLFRDRLAVDHRRWRLSLSPDLVWPGTEHQSNDGQMDDANSARREHRHSMWEKSPRLLLPRTISVRLFVPAPLRHGPGTLAHCVFHGIPLRG
ncbi:hypothetical protein HRbin36_00554 [bacterium HR36]|nr:hypothetical protein HRbin36_00554 [bacterium HR36]